MFTKLYKNGKKNIVLYNKYIEIIKNRNYRKKIINLHKSDNDDNFWLKHINLYINII